ncbi:carboxypeptidase regulatory-like domain-containing protein [Plantactinospora mayteni]|uniref:carboxypeptidase regulatory-like domain-containing protein n=1 Tax=Plantactinospora mayteni TaxID=566021 RepID=UPI0019414AD7|nr:carboxypeptidase regulatory-like domain-containing protein [Plantactinospora mayteni]
MSITGVNASLNAGQATTLNFSVKNNNSGGLLGGETSFDISVTSTFNELQCQGNCDVRDTIGFGDTKAYSVTLRAGNVAAGQSRSGNVRVTANVGNDSAAAQRNITVRGPEAPPPAQTVAEVSGRITNEATGDGVPNASVRLTDGQGRTHSATTSSNGNYRFTGSQDRPIAPGRLQIRATKDGITDTKDVTANAGARINNQGIQLALAGAPTATPDVSAEPTDDAAEDEPTDDAGAEESQDAGAPDQAANEDSGGGLGSWVLILAGGLLVALGVGAIVLLLMRRKEDGGDDDEDGPGGPGPRGAGAGRGGYRDDDATRVTNRAGAGADPTMVNRGGNLADAPTMMHSAPLVDDEFPDPYGAPLPGPQTPGYGGGGQQGWGNNANGYGDRPGSGAGAYGNAPGSGAGYGAPASGAGYGNAPGSGAGYGAPVSGSGGYSANGSAGYDDGYDEPTGRYTGGRGGTDEYAPAADPYETNAYRPSSGAGQGGYEPTQQYGRDDDGYDAGGYGAAGRGGYGDEPRTGAGYDRADDGYDQQQGYDTRAGGYDQQQGYDADRGGYDQPTTGGGYDQRRGGYQDQNGYDDRAGQNGYDDRAGYDQQQQAGGYYDDAPQAGHSRSGAPQQPSRSERRSLDWLDD